MNDELIDAYFFINPLERHYTAITARGVAMDLADANGGISHRVARNTVRAKRDTFWGRE